MRLECDIEALGELLDVEPPDWNGHCYEIASALVRIKVFDGVAVYGHYRGKLHPASRWVKYRHLGFVQHGWIVTPDHQIIDPVRWGFECKEPYIYQIDGDHPDAEIYDEGGNIWRAQQSRLLPKPEGEVCDIFATLIEAGESEAVHVVQALLVQSEPTTVKQLFWLANLPYEQFIGHASSIYSALRRLGHEVFVPLDNQRRAERTA
jgi:hypothetical protein